MSTVEAQLEELITSRLEVMAREADHLQHFEDGMLNLKARRDAFWAAWLAHQDDTRKLAAALLTYQTPPVALIADEPQQAGLPAPRPSIKPPDKNPDAVAQTRRIAEMLAPVNGRLNDMARRVRQQG